MPGQTTSAAVSTRTPTRGLSVSMLSSLPPAKGVSPYTVHLLEALAATGDVDVDVVGFRSMYPRWAYPGGDPAEAGAPPPSWLARVPAKEIISWWNPLSWVRAGFALNGDVVHAQWWSHVLAPVYATVLGIARLRGKRVVVTVHNASPHEPGIVSRFLTRAVLRFGHRLIVHSEQNGEHLRPAATVDVLPHGVLVAPRSGMTREEARARLDIPDSAKAVLCFGNIRSYKGIDVLLRAFAEVARDEPRAVLLIAGKPWVRWHPYAQLIDELHIADRVRTHLEFVPTSDVEAYFLAADVVALPYTSFDSQSGVGALALPFGRALIVSDAGGLPELTFDPDAVVPAGDAVALAAALRRALTDARWRERLEQDAARMADRLGWSEIAAATVEIYRSLLPLVPAEEPAAPVDEPVGAPQ